MSSMNKRASPLEKGLTENFMATPLLSCSGVVLILCFLFRRGKNIPFRLL